MAVSLYQASAALKELESKVNSEAVPISELSGDDVYETEEAREEALKSINAVKEMIRQCLDNHKAARRPSNEHEYLSNLVKTTADPDPNQTFKNATQNNLKKIAVVANGMPGSIKDITADFTSILNFPDIEKFSATLESSPAVGILNNTVQYMALSFEPATAKVNESWSLFDELPASPSGSDTAALFSYNGSFFVSVGQNVWQKTPKPEGDPSLANAAVDNWTQMFYPGWQALGPCLPTADSRCLAQYTQLASDGTPQLSVLVRLASDGSLSWGEGKPSHKVERAPWPNRPAEKFQPLLPVVGTLPPLLKIAYWENSIWGYDANNMIYQIKPAMFGTTLTGFEIGQSIQSPRHIVDFTAVDTGIVIAAKDGFLYNFKINPPENDTSPPTTSWDKSIAQGGVTNLSAAAPGVILDLRTLTGFLRSQYITTQTSLFPYINQILAFCTSHGVYLNQLLDASRKWEKARDPDQKQHIADTEGRDAVQHAKAMGQMLSVSLRAANQTVVEMSRQTSQINHSIASQIANIGAQIDSLQDTLNGLESKEKFLTAGIWVSVAGLFVGIGLIIAGFFFEQVAPYLWVSGGGLLIGSVVGIAVFASQRGKCRAAIASTQNAMAALTDSKNLLNTISKNFLDLAQDYGTLSSFWFDMLSVSDQIRDFEKLGIVLLADPSSIAAALLDNQKIVEDLTKYVQILGSQGITQPSLMASPPPTLLCPDTNVRAMIDHVASAQPNKLLRRPMQLELVSHLLQSANTQISAKDHQGYLSTMRKALALNAATHNLLLL